MWRRWEWLEALIFKIKAQYRHLHMIKTDPMKCTIHTSEIFKFPNRNLRIHFNIFPWWCSKRVYLKVTHSNTHLVSCLVHICITLYSLVVGWKPKPACPRTLSQFVYNMVEVEVASGSRMNSPVIGLQTTRVFLLYGSHKQTRPLHEFTTSNLWQSLLRAI